MQKLADQTGLKRSQVYKWYWDERKKEADLKKQQLTSSLFSFSSELGAASEIFKVVKN